jgi:hypothetical protein
MFRSGLDFNQGDKIRERELSLEPSSVKIVNDYTAWLETRQPHEGPEHFIDNHLSRR